MIKNKEEKLTSVKIIDELYRKFKEKAIRDDFSLQKLVNRTLDMFVYDEDFKKKILEKDGMKMDYKESDFPSLINC